MLNERVSEKHTAILFMSMQNRLHCLGICTLTIGICEQTIKKGGSVQSLSRVRLFATPWTAALQASLSITNSQSLLKLMYIELAMPFQPSHPLLPLCLLPSIFPSIRVFSNESVLHIRWPKYWSFNFSISPSNEY